MKKIVSKMIHEKNDALTSAYVDRVQLGVDGWKMRYYTSKFHCKPQDFQEF
jgi:5'-3' exonuclease